MPTLSRTFAARHVNEVCANGRHTLATNSRTLIGIFRTWRAMRHQGGERWGFDGVCAHQRTFKRSGVMGPNTKIVKITTKLTIRADGDYAVPEGYHHTNGDPPIYDWTSSDRPDCHSAVHSRGCLHDCVFQLLVRERDGQRLHRNPWQTDAQTDRGLGRHTGRQTEGQTDRQTDRHCLIGNAGLLCIRRACQYHQPII